MIVADATTLVAMCLIGKSDLIPKLVGKVSVSSVTERELKDTISAFDPDCAAPTADVMETVEVDVSGGAMSLSESETLELCRQNKANLLLSDDIVVRNEARKSRIKSIGTVGLLYAARARGFIEDLQEPIERLRQVGYALSPQCEQALLEKSAS